MNFISLINPESLANSFNINNGIRQGQAINAERQAQQLSALALTDQIRALNNSLAFESGFRNSDPNLALSDRFLAGGLASNNPFAALQGFNASASINQANLNQSAGQANLSLSNSLADLTRLRLSALDDEFPETTSLTRSTSTSAPERTNSTGARSLLTFGRGFQ